MKLHYTIPKEVTGGKEKKYAYDVKNLVQFFIIYFQARKHKANSLHIHFK